MPGLENEVMMAITSLARRNSVDARGVGFIGGMVGSATGLGVMVFCAVLRVTAWMELGALL